jgi:uncharacterized protein YcgI (DUF1989 family)
VSGNVALTPPHHECTVPGASGHAVVAKAGERVHIVNTLGAQVVDTWALTLPDGVHSLSMSHSRLAIGRTSPRVGDVLVDDDRQPILRLVGDDSHSTHDTLVPACDPQRYRALGHHGYHASCAENFSIAVAVFGLAPPSRVPDPLNLFMAVAVSADGRLTLNPSVAPPGSKVVVEAMRDVLLVVSACPQDLVPINGLDSPPRPVDLYLERSASAPDNGDLA